jgi:hypothetical protein
MFRNSDGGYELAARCSCQSFPWRVAPGEPDRARRAARLARHTRADREARGTPPAPPKDEVAWAEAAPEDRLGPRVRAGTLVMVACALGWFAGRTSSAAVHPPAAPVRTCSRDRTVRLHVVEAENEIARWKITWSDEKVAACDWMRLGDGDDLRSVGGDVVRLLIHHGTDRFRRDGRQ